MNNSLVWSVNQAVITAGTVITIQAVIPEPNSLSLAAIAGLLILARRRKLPTA